jgi:hypothetical protein
MGVTTTADEALDRADSAIQEATEQLARVVMEKCWGVEDYSQGRRDDFRQVFFALVELRDKLGVY